MLKSATIEAALDAEPPKKTLRGIHSGSWISSNFDIWIGEEEENRAWDVLGDTREFLQAQLDAGQLSEQQQAAAFREIYAAEGSDWFWWYGPDFSTDNDALFDDLFRQHLKNVYTLCGKLPPALLEEPITSMQVTPLYRKPEHPVSGKMTGRRQGSYFEWMGAGCYVAGSEQGAMYRSDRMLKQFQFGNDAGFLYLRVELVRSENVSLRIEFHGAAKASLEVQSLRQVGPGTYRWSDADGVSTDCPGLAVQDLVEMEVPLAKLGLNGDQLVRFQVKVLENGLERECYPERVPVEFVLTGREHALRNWTV